MPVVAMLLLCLFLALAFSQGRKPQPISEHNPEKDEVKSVHEPLTEETMRLWNEPLTPGVEAFSTTPLLQGEKYKIVLAGAYRYRKWDAPWGFWKRADACFDADDGPNFNRPYSRAHLFFACHPVVSPPFEEDRHLHRYTFFYTGTGTKLSILLNPPIGGRVITKETLSVAITPVSPEEHPLIEAWEACHKTDEERQAEEERGREVQRQAKEEQQREQERVAAGEKEAARRAEAEATKHVRLQELQVRYEAAPYYTDDDFIKAYAEKHRAALLADGERATIIQHYVNFHHDAEFVAYLKEHAPHLIPWETWKVRALALAERLDVAKPPPPAKRKLTAEEIRSFKVRRAEVQAGDKIAQTKAKIEAMLHARAELDQYDLNPDERQQLEQELIESIASSEEDDHGTTKSI